MTPHSDRQVEPLTLLVIDDERDVRDSLCEILEDAGYRVVCAENGAVGLAQLNRIPRPAAIVLDLFMPEMNGWRFAEQLKRRPDLAGIPVIVVTAAGPYWGMPVATDFVLRKPFHTSSLLRLLDQVLAV